jgi:Cu(I)/Ag(I) efflux system membrane protein CusA/SilA
MKALIDKVVELSVRNRLIVLLVVGAVGLGGVYCLYRTPVDAIPDLSENQVIVWADWMGRSPREIEDQVTYPLSVNLQGLAGVKAVRATSEFGFSMITLIFDDSIEYYFARQRVLERLSTAANLLPMGVVPYMAPDANAIGQIFWYTVEGEGRSLDELRSIQDWFVRYQLNSVRGVAEVASVGGFVREYQVDADPEKLRAYDVTLGQVFAAVQGANSSVGGKVIHKGGSEYLVRGLGWIRGVEDIRDVVVVERKGVPITVDQLAAVQLGPAFRRGVLEKDGREAVGGVVMMRAGENPLAVIERVKEKIRDLRKGLPPGVRIVPFYDRTGLIEASIGTLTGTLVEEIAVVSLVVFLVLWHVRSAFVICVTLPLAVLISFIFMYALKIPSNIMSLSGIAISIGVLVDAGIVMTENAYHRLRDRFKGEPVTGDTRETVIEACKVVGQPLFFSIVIMLLSFAPIFVLGGMEGRMFNPLAYTKTFALVGVAFLAITLVPAIIPWFVRGRLKAQEDVWLVRSFANIYRPMLDFFLRYPDVIVVLTGFFMVASLPLFPRRTEVAAKIPWLFFVAGVPFFIGATAALVARWKPACLGILAIAALTAYLRLSPLGEEFMPPLNELAIMDMPTSRPNLNLTQAGDDLRERDRFLREFPEVHQVVGKVGRAETPTDPAPPDMVETVVSLRPVAWWPKRKILYDDAAAEAREVARSLRARGLLKDLPDADLGDFANTAAMDAATRYDRFARELSLRRLREFIPEKGRLLGRLLRDEVLALLRSKGALKREPGEAEGALLDERLVRNHARSFDEWILAEDVERAVGRVVDFLAEKGAVDPAPDLLVEPEAPLSGALDALRAITGRARPTLYSRIREKLEERHDELMRERVRRLDWELVERGPRALVGALVEEAVAKGRKQRKLARDPAPEELEAVRREREEPFVKKVFLWKKTQDDVRTEMDSELQVPGWGNIWTRPIQNRVDMLATGVRTAVGVKITASEPDFDTLQRLAEEVREALKGVRGAVDVTAEPVTGENYLEISIDRKKAARYGVRLQDLQSAIEVALGGKEVTTTVEGSARYPVRVRYPREWRADEERIRDILVPAGAGGGGEMAMGADGPAMKAAGAEAPAPPAGRRQIPLSLVADVRIAPGPSMIKSENGRLRTTVQLNVRGRDIVGLVEEAQRVVESKVKLPEGFTIEWTGQFEHQVRAQRTLTVVLPMVILIIFIILYMTYKDAPDTLMMFLAVPGAIAGGAIFQAIFGYNFSVAVWVGYVGCFGLATETAIVMLVYLREAIERRGGIGKIETEAQIREAVMEGAVARLRPKLLTEGTTILALIPMLWATGVGAEFMRPMAAPILGGILVADEVIDILIPVLFYHDRCRRLRKRKEREAGAAGAVPA